MSKKKQKNGKNKYLSHILVCVFIAISLNAICNVVVVVVVVVLQSFCSVWFGSVSFVWPRNTILNSCQPTLISISNKTRMGKKGNKEVR